MRRDTCARAYALAIVQGVGGHDDWDQNVAMTGWLIVSPQPPESERNKLLLWWSVFKICRIKCLSQKAQLCPMLFWWGDGCLATVERDIIAMHNCCVACGWVCEWGREMVNARGETLTSSDSGFRRSKTLFNSMSDLWRYPLSNWAPIKEAISDCGVKSQFDFHAST